MSELQKFMFEGLPVRGAVVRLTGAWQEVLQRRAANTKSGAYPVPLQTLLGEMAAASLLMHSNIKFNGALILQIEGDGPVQIAVVEANADLSFRATATLAESQESAPDGEPAVAPHATLSQMVNVNNQGRCVITLDPKNRVPGQQSYQGVVPLFGDHKEKLERVSDVLAHYMLQSEQLETTLVLAANGSVAAGLLVQRMPQTGGKPQGQQAAGAEVDVGADALEAYNRISILASSLQRDELLSLDADAILHRLFWEEKLLRFEPASGTPQPRFACTCSRERVSQMIKSLGAEETGSIIAERGDIEVGCEFCGQQYRFDAVDAAQIFTGFLLQVQGSTSIQ
jgi:molecular chaperone Hsp33